VTIWIPGSCFCIIDFGYPYNELTAKFIQRCRTHRNPQQTLQHHRGFTGRDGRNPTEQQQAQQGIDMALEKARPQFQKR